MRRVTWRVAQLCLCCATATVCLAGALPPRVATAATAAVVGRTIVIDPGHGGIDPGATANRLEEKDLTLPIGLQVGNVLTQRGAHVIYTRTSDVTVGVHDDSYDGLDARTALANAAAADLYVSVHANALDDPSFSGVMTFFGDESGYVNNVTRTPEQVAQSRLLAQDVQEAVQQDTGEIDRGVRDADFFVLGNADMPSILVETGFITDPSEAQRLSTPGYQQIVATGIADGIGQYLASVGTTVKQANAANDAQFVADVTYPDHATVSAGQSIVKTWQVTNTGTAAWTPSERLTLQPGGNVTAQSTLPLPAAAPGATVSISVPLQVPMIPGTVSAAWRLTDANGQPFGDPLWMLAQVPGATQAPKWLQTTRTTNLWTDFDAHADAIFTLAPQTYLKLLAPQEISRIEVEEPVTGRKGYVNAQDVGPSGPPPSDYQGAGVAPVFTPFSAQTTTTTPLVSGVTDPVVTFNVLAPKTPLNVLAPQQGSRLYVRDLATGGVGYVDAQAVERSTTPKAALSTTQTYTVKPGDTLTKIAKQYQVSVSALANANNLTDVNKVKVGTVLTIPSGAPTFQPFWVETTAKATLWSGADANAQSFGTVPQWTSMLVLAPSSGTRYEVRIWTTGHVAYVDTKLVGPAGPPKGAD